MEIISVADAQALPAAMAAIARGECIVFPTDTVYGIAARCDDAVAVQRLLTAKQRGRDMPPPVLAADATDLQPLAQWSAAATALAERFWPGAMTLILPRDGELVLELGELVDTIAVRVPDHDFTRLLLRATGPLAVSSANISGQPAALTIEEAVNQLGESVAVYLDGGLASGPTPSTIIDLVANTIRRPGRLDPAEIQATHPNLAEVTCASTC